MLSFILGILGLAAITITFFALGCIAGCLAIIEKLSDGNTEKKLEICDKLNTKK